MSLSFIQKTQLFLLFLVINLLWVVDYIGSVLGRMSLGLVRVILFVLVVASIMTGFRLDSKSQMFYALPDVITPFPSVLGVRVEKSSPALVKDVSLPAVTASAIYVVDVLTSEVLVDINSEKAFAPASTTKLMTALVSLDVYDVDDLLVIPESCTKIEGLKTGFGAGHTYYVKDLVSSLLINSSADAACALSIGKIPYLEFIGKMNLYAKEIDMVTTLFTNPVGLDGANDDHLSTARDLLLLAQKATEDELIKEIVGTKEKEIRSVEGDVVVIQNTNALLWEIVGSVGIKTGRTDSAGEVLIYEYDNDGVNVIIVVLGSTDRFGDTKRILNWVFESYGWD